ncbi:HPr family phosphocarrier protein [Ectobacillus funiculus]|uniref:HPr family phosphocarrier protein n=1 Tax=Ectobacillus funiculus TaxID=137993 RepID=A0ABV5WG20_9BACI
MMKKKIIVQLQHGLQARIAAEFVQKASSFESEIHVIKDGRSVVGKSVMGVMAIAAREGEEITLIVNGRDEQKAVTALESFLSGREFRADQTYIIR